jgi:hypothetical protein
VPTREYKQISAWARPLRGLSPPYNVTERFMRVHSIDAVAIDIPLNKIFGGSTSLFLIAFSLIAI